MHLERRRLPRLQLPRRLHLEPGRAVVRALPRGRTTDPSQDVADEDKGHRCNRRRLAFLFHVQVL